MIKDHLLQQFDYEVRKRGKKYFVERLVKLTKGGKWDAFKALASGSEDYALTFTCTIAKRMLKVRASCTCPYVDSYGAPCKHMWATILAADQAGYFKSTESMVDYAELVVDPDGEIDINDVVVKEKSDDHDQSMEAIIKLASTAMHKGQRVDLAKLFAELQLKQKFKPTPPPPEASKPPQPPKPVEPSLDWLQRLQGGGYYYDNYSGSSNSSKKHEPIHPLYVLEADGRATAGHFILGLWQQTITASGKFGKIKKLSLLPHDVSRIPTPEDRELCRLFTGVGAPSKYGYYDPHGSSSWDIPPQVLKELLPRLFATGKMHFIRQPNETPQPLRWDTGEPWELLAKVVSVSTESAKTPATYRMMGVLRRGDLEQEISAGDVFFHGGPEESGLPAAGLRLHGNELSSVQLHGGISWTVVASSSASRLFSTAQVPVVLAKLAEMNSLPPLVLPPQLGVHEVTDLLPLPEATITSPPYPVTSSATQFNLELQFRYGDDLVSAGNARRYLHRKDGSLVHRQRDAEHKYRARLLELGALARSGNNLLGVRAKQVPRIVAALLSEGWRVLGDKNIYRKPGNVSMSVSSGIDWFDITGGVDFDGQIVSIPRLLQAIREGQQFVVLGDGSLGVLPEEWLAKNSRWLEMGKSGGEKIRFIRAQLPLVDALLVEMPEIAIDQELHAARQRLRKFEGIKAHGEPAGFTGKLRPYQQQGLGWLHFLREFGWGGCLADDMGLGKTIQLLAMLAQRKLLEEKDVGPSLVIAPKSLIFNWAREAEKFTPELKVLTYTGTERTSTRELFRQHHLVLTTYGTLLRDIEHLTKQEFDYVVLDEAQAIKNPGSQSAKAVRLLRAKHRLALTGTPVENQLSDLWSIFEFLNPGMLGALNAFKGAITTNRPDSKSESLVTLQRAMRPFILRRTKSEVLTELPPRTEQTITCQMGKEQSALYDELREHYRASLLGKVETQGLESTTFQVLEALLRLRQAACHPGLLDPTNAKMESAKLEALIPMLTELLEENHKALVFSQFTSLLALLRVELDKRKIVYEYLDGKTIKRDKHVDRFQTDPDCKLMLISLKAGGVGLNLTAADYVFILDPWWNPAAEAQAIDRAHRMGQTRHVNAYRLITQNTVEEKIVQLQQSKRALADAIITEQNSLISNLTRDELSQLLS